MSVKAQQLAKDGSSKTEKSGSSSTNQVRGFAGNHTLNKQRTNSENNSAVLSQSTTRVAEEHAAEQFASRVGTAPGVDSPAHRNGGNAPAQVSNTSNLSPAVSHMLSSTSRPLEPKQRAKFEPMLGQSLADVRLHVGSAADAATRSVKAEALTIGSHVGFAAGHYSPGTASGERTLAHELAHVVQQQTHGPARVRYRLLKPVVRAIQLLPYQELFEAIDFAEQKRLEDLPLFLAMRDLAVALVDRDVSRTKKLVAELLPLISTIHVSSGEKVSLEQVVIRLIGDVLDLELFDESQLLRKAFTDQQGWIGNTRGGQEEREHTAFEIIIDRVIGELDISSPESAESSIERLLRVFFSIASQVPLYRGFETPWEQLLKRLALAAVEAFQVLMEAATVELESRAGTTRELTRARAVLERMGHVILSHYPEDTILSIDVTRSDFEAKKPQHLDYFRRDKKAPSVGISAYSRIEPTFKEKKLGLRRVMEIRADQLNALEHIFGLERDRDGKVTEKSKENAEAVAAVGDFQLNDNESWRKFSLNKFRLARKRLGDDGAALSATIDVLRIYLRAFTIHTPSNIDDFGDEYLSKSFPRALTGQLIHDCGVYALRIAYALSLVRSELDLDIRAIVLPVHVGLIISFKNRNYPAFVTHNNDLIELDEDAIADHRERWVKSKGPMKMRFEQSDLLAHIAASEFISGVDVPYRVETLPAVPYVKDVKKRHAALWDFYLKKLVRPEVVRPAAGVDQPELLFLSIIEAQREIHDTYSVPLWRKGHEWWKRHENLLNRALDQYHPGTTAGRPLVVAAPRAAANVMFRDEIGSHWEELWNMSAEWRRAIVQLQKARDEVTAFMNANPSALEPHAQMTKWGKLVMPWEEEQEFWDYVGDPGTETDRLESDSGVAFKKVVAKGNSRLLKGDVFPPWALSNLMRPVD